MKMFSSESEYWVQSELTIKQHNIYQTAIPRSESASSTNAARCAALAAARC